MFLVDSISLLNEGEKNKKAFPDICSIDWENQVYPIMKCIFECFAIFGWYTVFYITKNKELSWGPVLIFLGFGFYLQLIILTFYCLNLAETEMVWCHWIAPFSHYLFSSFKEFIYFVFHFLSSLLFLSKTIIIVCKHLHDSHVHQI